MQRYFLIPEKLILVRLFCLIGRFQEARNGPICCLDSPHTTEAIAVRETLSWLKEEG